MVVELTRLSSFGTPYKRLVLRFHVPPCFSDKKTMASLRFFLPAIPALLMCVEAAPPKVQHFTPVLFELEPNARYASTDLDRWEVFTRRGVSIGPSLSIEFLDTDPGMRLEGQGRSTPKLSVFRGNDSSQWRPDCASFEALAYRSLYPGIDLVYRRLEGGLKGDFIVQAGVDSGEIRFRFHGAQVSLVGDTLRIQTVRETLEEHIPAVYELPSRKPVNAHYNRHPDGSIGIEVEGRDPGQQLVIDPNLTFSSFIAGSLLDQVTATAFSSAENMLLVTGWTETGDLLGANPSTYKRGADGYYGRFSVASNGAVSLSSMTLFGGNGNDKPLAISVSPTGAVAIAGSTSSSNFPTLLAYQTTLSGTSDGFLIRFPAGGTTLSSSTYFGGTGTEQINAVALDLGGKVYFAGTTSSKVLPVTSGALQVTFKGGSTDGFVGTLTSGSSPTLGYLTFLGGSGTDSVAGLAQLNGEVYLTGATDSWDFWLSAGAFQLAGGGAQDAFVTKLNALGQISYSTYLGGTGGTVGQPEMGTAIAVTAAGEAYVTGVTSSSNFPVTASAAQHTLNAAYGQPDAFLTKFTAAGGVGFSTLWGGASWEQSNAVTILRNGLIAIAGQTSSLDFPVLWPTQLSLASSGSYDAFVAVFTSSGAALYSSYFGGSGSDSAAAIAGTPTNEIFVGGLTGSFDMPKVNPLQSNITSSGYHGFLARVGPSQMAGVYRPSAQTFYLIADFDFANYARYPAYSWKNVPCSNPRPVVGDWDNTGWTRIGLFCDGTWYLDMDGDNLFTGADRALNFGWAGVLPVVGDWDNTGRQRLGFFQNGLWFLDLVGDYVVRYNPRSPCTTSDCPVIAMGGPGDYPIVGDFANDGHTRLGIVRYNHWLLDVNGDYQADTNYNFGTQRDYYLFADWDNSGTKRIGLFRSYQDQFGNIDYPSGWWFFDITGNNFLDSVIYPCQPDRCVSYGIANDLPVVGVRGSWR